MHKCAASKVLYWTYCHLKHIYATMSCHDTYPKHMYAKQNPFVSYHEFSFLFGRYTTAVKIVCSSIFRFILAINTQCAVIDMQIILNDILHDLWIHMTVSSGPKSVLFFVGTLNFIMAIAQKIGHLEDWNQCHLLQLELWIFSQKSFCPQTPW